MISRLSSQHVISEREHTKNSDNVHSLIRIEREKNGTKYLPDHSVRR